MSKILKNKNKRPKKIIYKQIRIKENTSLSYDSILTIYGVKVNSLKTEDNSKVFVGFNTEKHENIVESFINSGWNLISVSEDTKSITYHFTKEIYI